MTNVCHIITGDLWAGAESQVFSLVKRLSKEINIIVIVFNNGLLADKLKHHRIRTYVIDEKINTSIKIILQIAKILKNENINLIHTHGYKETFLAGIASKINGIKKKVRTHHGRGIIGGDYKHYWIEKLNSSLFGYSLIAVSKDLKEFLVHNGIGGKTIEVIYNGISTDDVTSEKSELKVKNELGIPDGAMIIGTMGRMVGVKGHQYLLEGAKNIIDANPNIFFVIAGNGPLMQKNKEWVHNEGLTNNIKLIGFRNDPYDILNIFDIFVLTSLHEGIPMVLLEAMYMEKPVIATNVGGIPEIISDGENGILIPSMSSRAFTEACLELILNMNKGLQMAKNAKKDVLDKYTDDAVTEKVIKFYVGK